MPYDDTQTGGPPLPFPETTWGLISKLHGSAERAGFEALCQRYWKPVYRHLRLTWAKSNEDAKDATQAFFLWLMDGDTLAKYDPERGSFRRYLKILLGGFVGHEWEALQRLKRGGGRRLLPLDHESVPEIPADPQSADPQIQFDRAWMAEVLRLAVERVRRHLLASGRERQVRVYEEYELTASDPAPTYSEVASRLGLKENDVRNYLFEVRELVRAEVRAELRDTCSDENGFRSEWNELFGS